MEYTEEIYLVVIENENFIKEPPEVIELCMFSVLDILEEGLLTPAEKLRCKRAVNKCYNMLIKQDKNKALEFRDYSNLMEIVK